MNEMFLSIAQLMIILFVIGGAVWLLQRFVNHD